MTSRTARGLLAVAAAAIATLLGVEPAMGENVKTAGRLYLSSGDVFAIAFTSTGNPNREDSTLIVRDETTGMVVTLVEKIDFQTYRYDARISSAKETIHVWKWLGFGKEGLPTPMEAQIAQKTYRALTSSAHPNPPELVRIKDAVRALPADFVALLKKLSALESQNIVMLAFTTLDELTGVQKQPLSVTESVKLQPGEIDALIRESAGR